MISDKAITLANSPHMTDGFTEFFCLYLYGVYTIDGATVLEVIDFMIDKTYYMKVFIIFIFETYHMLLIRWFMLYDSY